MRNVLDDRTIMDSVRTAVNPHLGRVLTTMMKGREKGYRRTVHLGKSRQPDQTDAERRDCTEGMQRGWFDSWS